MNKVILMGRLTKEPEVRYTKSADPVAVCRYTLAVNKSFKREGEPDADFINVVAFAKRGEFAEKYFKKGQMVSVVGRLQVRSWDNDEGKKQWSTEVVIDEQFFAESRASFENRGEGQSNSNNETNKSGSNDGFFPINESVNSDDLPF